MVQRERVHIDARKRWRIARRVPVHLKLGEIGQGLRLEALLGIKEKDAVDHGITGERRARLLLSGGVHSRNCSARGSPGSPLGIRPVRVVIPVIRLDAIRALGCKDNAGHEIVHGNLEVCIATELTFLPDIANDLQQHRRIRLRNLIPLRLCEIDEVALEIRIGEERRDQRVAGKSRCHRRAEEQLKGIVLRSDTLSVGGAGRVHIHDRIEVGHLPEGHVDVDLRVLKRRQRERKTGVLREPEVQGDDKLARADARLGNRGLREFSRNGDRRDGVRVLVPAIIGIRGVRQLGNVSDHLVDNLALVPVMRHVGIELEPLAAESLDDLPVHRKVHVVDQIVADIVDPLELIAD